MLGQRELRRGTSRPRYGACCVCALIAGLLPVASSSVAAAFPVEASANIRIEGASRIGPAGDVNGDGKRDFLVAEGWRGSGIVDPDEPNRVYVIFGSDDAGSIDVDNLGAHGFVINSATPGDFGSIAASAGDVNGDGLDDIVVGAPDQGGGTAYVVFGKTDTRPVELLLFHLNAQGAAGFRVDGNGGLAGRTVAGLGDMNGDGLADVIVGAPFKGESYVVFGKADPLPILLGYLGQGLPGHDGFRIKTPMPDVDRGYHVAGIGDFNGDKTPDLAVGRSNQHGPAKGCCDSWVVFGKSDSADVDTTRLRDKGFRIKGDGFVAPAGDVNNDGYHDLLQTDSVLYGSASSKDVRLANLGRRGFRFAPNLLGNQFSHGGEDVNGDGFDDVVFGVPTDNQAGVHSGSAYVVFGARNLPKVVERRLGDRGFRIDGVGPETYTASTVALLGDINGDGLSEIGIDSPIPAPSGGRAFVLWGRR